MRTMFGINYIALSGLYLCLVYSVGLCHTLTDYIPSGLQNIVLKGRYKLGLDTNPSRLNINVTSPERATYNKV